MAARSLGRARPTKTSDAQLHPRGASRAVRQYVHALGAMGVLFMAAAMNFAMYPEALAAVVSGEQMVDGFVPEDPAGLAEGATAAPVVNDDEVRLLAATVWGEARSEGEEGMRAVAHVMVNRVGDRFGEDLATVLLTPMQFSVWNRGDPNRRLVQGLVRDPARDADPQWEQAQRIAREVLAGQSVDPTDGALFYHTRAVRPRWARYGLGRQVIGQHIFYSDVPDAGTRRTPRVTNVAHIFGRPMLIGPSTGVQTAALSVNAAATPTLNGVPITQVQHAGAAH